MISDLRQASQAASTQDEQMRLVRVQIAMNYITNVPPYSGVDDAQKPIQNPSYDDNVSRQANRVVLNYLNRDKE